MTDRATWYRIRREMFDQLMAEVSSRLGPEDPSIRRARRAYQKEVNSSWKVSDRTELAQAFRQHDVTLIGDFHALLQSQKTQRRLLEQFFEASNLSFDLGVECLPKSSQKWIDAFLGGEIDEKEFLRKTRWEKVWGFPWEHYREIFLWAKERSLRVVALNTLKSSLKERDRFAAKTIAAEVRRGRNRWVILFGDLHLREASLPRELVKAGLPEPLRIFQNVEEASFRLMQKGLDHRTDVVRYDSHRYAVLSIPPWVKWQNYLLWLDQNLDEELEESVDLTDSVLRYVRWIKQELKLEVNEAELSVYSAGDPDLWSRVRKTARPQERKWLEMMIEDGRSFYLSKAGWGYLARPSVNHAASLAMQFIHDRLCGGAALRFQFPDDFPRMIWIESVAYFGSKLINPKRKANTLKDIRASLSSQQGRDAGREALRMALSQKMIELMRGDDQAFELTPYRPKRPASWIAAAHLLGGLAGERLAEAFQKGRLGSDEILALLKKPLHHDRFDLIYLELLDMIESLPAPFLSKKEKL